MTTDRDALGVLSQEHPRDSLHVYDITEKRGINCRVCDALAALAAAPEPPALDVRLQSEAHYTSTERRPDPIVKDEPPALDVERAAGAALASALAELEKRGYRLVGDADDDEVLRAVSEAKADRDAEPPALDVERLSEDFDVFLMYGSGLLVGQDKLLRLFMDEGLKLSRAIKSGEYARLASEGE